PPRVPTKYTINEGEIATSNIIAPYDFFVPRTEQELYEEKKGIAARIPPVFDLDNTVYKMVMKKLDGLVNLIDSLRDISSLTEDSLVFLTQKEYALDGIVIRYLTRTRFRNTYEDLIDELGNIYAAGVVDAKPPQFRIITIASGDKEIVESLERLYSIAYAVLPTSK
ncbi:unnamed protein product, partial [marine sediment metagenome]